MTTPTFTPLDSIKDKVDSWNFYFDSYTGGEAYREGDYLYRHEKESEDAYKRRKKQAVFSNLCSPVIDVYTSYLYRDGVNRSFEGLSQHVVESITTNADLDNRTWDRLWHRIAVMAGIYGVVGVIVDKPYGDAETLQDEIDGGLYPYVTTYEPISFISWTYSPESGFRDLVELILKEDSPDDDVFEYYKIWTPVSWSLWKQKGTEDSIKVTSGENTLGRIPFVFVKNRDVVHKRFGVSDIADVADLNKRIYFLDSDALEIIERTAFPFLEVPMKRGMEDGSEGKALGSGNILQYDANMPGSRHAWVEPNHASLDRILEWRNQAVDDIRATSKIAGNDAIRTQSGVALEIRFQQLNAILAEKATSMETAEALVLKLVALWDNSEWKGEVKYPKQFGVRDLAFDLDQMIKAAPAIPSETFNTELAKSIAGRMLPHPTSDIIKAVNKELDEADFSIEDEIDKANAVGPSPLPPKQVKTGNQPSD